MNRRVALSRLLSVLVVSVAGVACANLPRDPRRTLVRVQGGRLRVGLVEHPPWVVRTTGEPAGAEVLLVRQLAQELGATPEWYWGGEQQHMEALARFELDLVVGGLTKETPWSKHVGLTSPYFEERIIVGVPRAMPPLDELKGVEVAAQGGEVTAAYLEKKGARPVRVADIAHANLPAAAPEWQLAQLGFTATRIELDTQQHVLAAPPGENAWIKRLDEYLARQRPQVASLLQQAEAQR